MILSWCSEVNATGKDAWDKRRKERICCAIEILSKVSHLFSTSEKALEWSTHFWYPRGLTITSAIIWGVKMSWGEQPKIAQTCSGRWQRCKMGTPAASIPATPMICLVWARMTGSCSAGALKGRCLAPSASMSTMSASVSAWAKNWSEGAENFWGFWAFWHR